VRVTLSAAIIALAVWLAAPLAAGAQDEAPTPAARKEAPLPPLPSKPIPYTKLYPKKAAKPKPKPKPSVAKPATSAALNATPATPAPGAAPAPAPPPAPAAPPVATAPAPEAPPAAVQPGARLTAGQPLPLVELQAFVDGWVRAGMARNHIAGVTVSVVQNGQVVLKKGYGFASLSPARAVDPDRTLFRIGSISKTFTWIALMKEVEAGRIRLDQPVNAYLPEALRVKDQGFDQPIRVINLMDHSPGFEDRALGHLFEDRFDRVRPLEVYLRQERPRRVRPPGVLSSYSNYGAALAGEAAATTARKPYEQLIEDEILGPARLAHTSFREPHPPMANLPAPMPAALAASLSDAFRWEAGGFQRQPFEYVEQIAPAGAASSTAGDMARYMLLLLGNGTLEGATVYGPATAKAFRTPIQKTADGFNGWAHGFAIQTLPGGHVGYGHDGGTLSFFSNMVVVPDLNLGVFISTNTTGGGVLAGRFAQDLIRAFYAAPQPFPRAGAPDLAGQRDVFRGHYVGTRRAYSGLEGFVTRLGPAGVDVDVTPDGKLVLASFGQATPFVPEGPVVDGRFIGLQDDARLQFRLQDGRAASFIGSDNAVVFERVSAWKGPATLALAAGLAAVAAVATLLGLIFRSRRDLRENPMQARASIVQNIQAGLWLTALVLFGLFFAHAVSDLSWVMYGWPSPLIILASACALVAAALTLLTIAALPAVWSGGRRVDSWSPLRKLAFTITVAIYVAFSVMLALWGALMPWSG
jgi:CubicO group peptidase (beta-lactamase class C family)